MKHEPCERTRRLLIDAGGSEAALPPDLAAHLGSCEECGRFAELLARLAKDSGAPRVLPDYTGIDLAFDRAAAIVNGRREAGRFVLFLGAALAAMTAFCLAGLSGHAKALLALQAAAFLALPLAAILIIARRAKGTSTWTT